MKDMLGVEVEVGDVIVSASGQGRHKVGKVYGFISGNGLALIHSLGNVYNAKSRQYEPKWTKVSSGYSVLVIGREKLGQMQPTPETWNAIRREYPE
jgi:hypothetical protein